MSSLCSLSECYQTLLTFQKSSFIGFSRNVNNHCCLQLLVIIITTVVVIVIIIVNTEAALTPTQH